MPGIIEGSAYPSAKLTVDVVNTFTQTYADTTLENTAPTATALTSFGESANATLVDVETTGVADPAKVNANFDDVADAINKLIVDLAVAKKLINSLIDAEQARGLSG